MNRNVLFVDDEKNVLKCLKRLFMDEDMTVFTAESAKEALDIIKTNSISVIVSDNYMPQMKGVEFLQKAKLISPESVKILLTAHADVTTAIDAINNGEVYKFITKPWCDEELRDKVFDAVKRYETAMSLKKADESTLLSLAQTIELKDPYTRGHCDRVAKYALLIAEMTGLSEIQLRHIKYGGWLHDCGKIGIPESILNLNGRLSDEQMDVVKNHCRWGADVAKIARLPEPVVHIILYHHERFDGKGYPTGLTGTDIPLEARIVSISDFFDALSSDRPYRKKLPIKEALKIVMDSIGTFFDPDIAEVFEKVIIKEGLNG
jgi:putative two-component system response regulator